MHNFRALATQNLLPTSKHVIREGCGGIMDRAVERGDRGPMFLLHRVVSKCPDDLITCMEHLERLNHPGWHLEKQGRVTHIWDTGCPRWVMYISCFPYHPSFFPSCSPFFHFLISGGRIGSHCGGSAGIGVGVGVWPLHVRWERGGVIWQWDRALERGKTQINSVACCPPKGCCGESNGGAKHSFHLFQHIRVERNNVLKEGPKSCGGVLLQEVVECNVVFEDEVGWGRV
jgi:hypothetical protein